MTTDELREKYGKAIHFNCKDGDEAFTDGYVLWLEEQLISYHEALQLAGKLALKADLVKRSNTTFLSSRIEQLSNALKDYDDKIFEMMDERKPTP